MIGFRILNHAHYAKIKRKLRDADEKLLQEYPVTKNAPAIDPKDPTAVFIVGSCRSGGIYALDWVRREFPNHFCNCIFMNVRTVDAVSFGGPEALESVRRDADKTLDYFVNFCNNRGLAAQALSWLRH